MSYRRSTRLANRASIRGDSGPGSALVDEKTPDVDSRNRTPYARSSQKRKRGFTDTKSAETGSYNYEDTTPNLLIKSGGSTSARRLSLDGSALFSPLSLGSESFLLALDEIEKNEKNSHSLIDGKFVGIECETNRCGSTSPDIFGGDNGVVVIKPSTSPPNNAIQTPKRISNAFIPPRRVHDFKTIQTAPKQSEFPSARNALESEKSREKELNPRQKKSTNIEKKKNAGAQGKGPKVKQRRKGKFKLAFTNRKHIKELANSASNELSSMDLSEMTDDKKLLLSSWGLPRAILNNYRSKGITSLFPWQLECLGNEKVLEGRNLLYSAPTSAGKTLVSEILMIKRVLELGRKAIMILPFVSVAREKVYSLQSIFGDQGIRVEGFMGSVNPPGGFKAVDIAVCTIEKANSLLNKLLEEDALADLGTLVVDELHLIGDPHRGYLLELLLTKILYMTSIKNNGENSLNVSEGASWRPRRYHIQVIGMSATLPNLDVLARWLNAELYVTDFRPVPLKERLKVEEKLLDETLQPIRDVKVEQLPVQIDGDIDDIVYLSLETVLEGFSVLIFCPTKVQVESTAKRIAENFFHIGDPTNSQYAEIGTKLRSRLDGNRIKTVFEQLKQCPGGSDEVLSNTIMFGIGYHHAGLTYENRDIVESAFKRGILKVIVATSTLSAGVNLPARRVMIVTPMFNRSVLDTMTYRQMCGRAGRNGIDTEGESILICPSAFKEKGIQLFKGQMSIVKSALMGDGSLTSSMKRALLEVVASGIATLEQDVRSYANCTFLFHTLDAALYESDELPLSQANKETTIGACINFLLENRFIRIQHYEEENRPDEYKPTHLGSACLAASLSPDDGITVFHELAKARGCFVLQNDLHIIYLVTPIYVSDQLRNISWEDYLKIWENFDTSEQKVAELVGIKECFIFKAMMGVVSWQNPNQRTEMLIHQRFFAALALNDLVKEKSLAFVGNKYNLSKGVLQNLQQSASTFAGMVTAFCGRLGPDWATLGLILARFQERLEFGVHLQLCDLIRLDCLNGPRARILYDEGLKSIVELAAADPVKVEQILHKATPFNSNAQRGREYGRERESIWMIGKETLTEAEAAKKMVEEARMFIQMELGHQGNIRFAFGGNDIPTITAAKQDANTNHYDAIDSDKIGLLSGKSHDEKLQDFSKSNIDSEQSESLVKSVLGQCERQSNSVKEMDDNNDTHSEMFPPGQPDQLEQKSISLAENRIEEGMFEDSFPEIVSTEMSALFLKSCNRLEENRNTKFSIEKEIEKVDANNFEKRRMQGRVQCDSSTMQHSTPVDTFGSLKRQLFTVNKDNSNSQLHSSKDEEKYLKEHMNVPSSDCEEISHRILAELEKDFNNSFEDVSFNGNANSVEGALIDNKNTKSNRSNVALTDSVADAMKALAEDTDFDSEELFPAVDVTEPVNPKSPKIKEEDDLLDGLQEEDFILTQVSFTSDKFITDEKDMFEESSSDTESSCPTANAIPLAEISVHETMVGPNNKLTSKIVTSVDAIPSCFFTELIGVDIKLVSPKKPSGSIARQGIGARVISKNPMVNPLTDFPQGDLYHSIALYNGFDNIWVLRWKNESGLRVSGSRKKSVKNEELLKLLAKIREASSAVAIFQSKEKIKNLLKHCGDNQLFTKLPMKHIYDPTIAQWMWDFNDEDWNVTKSKLIEAYVTEEETSILSSNLDKEMVDAFLAWKVMSALKGKLLLTGLWDHFITTEMPSTVPLLLMEMNGLGLDSVELNKLKRVLQFKTALLELRAFQLAGRQFNLGSPKDIKQILFREIGLTQPKGSKGTGKDVLLKLDHELPGIIVEWRKATSALHKVLIPFQQERNLETGRVHGQYSHFTVTGRVVMSDPSLQCVPRDFDIEISYDPEELREIKSSCKIKFGSKLAGLFQQLDSTAVDAYTLNNISVISMRNAFVPCSDDFVILTADYSQLELRILAHLCGDVKLLEALNKDTDVFIEIATQWKKLPRSKITNSIRQEAKSIVYGVIYGMGTKALAEQMEIEEREAADFITQFLRAYPKIVSFIEKTQRSCQKKGYVETMSGRRRYLPLIYSRNQQEKAKADRQAVNSRIQGSAADLVKAAMARIHSFLQSTYPRSALPIEWNKLYKARRSSVSFQASTESTQLENLVFFPILNLHDELIFEVRKTHLENVAKAVKHEMESCIRLDVKLPVVIKTGETWGTMKEYNW